MRTILFVFSFIIFGTVTAQDINENFVIEKGSWSLGGDFNLSWENYENRTNMYSSDYNRLGIDARPQVGFAVGENLLVGIRGNFYFSDYKTFDAAETHFRAYGVGAQPFIRKYYNITQRLLFNLDGALGYNYERQNNVVDSYTTRERHSFLAIVRPGLSYFISNNLALETSIGSFSYSRFSEKGNQNMESLGHSFRAQLNLNSIYFGINYFF